MNSLVKPVETQFRKRNFLIIFQLISFLIFLGAIFSSNLSYAAYLVAELPTQNGQENLGTHIIIAGSGKDAGDQWLNIAHTQALIFKDRAQHGRILLISALDDISYRKKVSQWGYIHIQVKDSKFNADSLISELGHINLIHSVDFIGHNGAILGFMLQNSENRFYLNDIPKLQALKSHFGKNSFVRIMGCNTGWTLAPAIANALSVPTAGTFTFSDIQSMHESKTWYYNDAGRFPGGKFINFNEISFFEPQTCIQGGGCQRMKVVNIPYHGKLGNYSGTLPYMKYFCGSLQKSDCFRRMAESTQYLIGSTPLNEKPSLGEFAQTLADQFCPSSAHPERREACLERIQDFILGKTHLEKTYNSTSESPISCTFQKCEVEKYCPQDGGSCVMRAKKVNGPITSFIDELNAYVEGYKIWVK